MWTNLLALMRIFHLQWFLAGRSHCHLLHVPLYQTTSSRHWTFYEDEEIMNYSELQVASPTPLYDFWAIEFIRKPPRPLLHTVLLDFLSMSIRDVQASDRADVYVNIMLISSVFLSVVPRPATLASPANMLEMQVFRAHPRPIASEILGVVSSKSVL